MASILEIGTMPSYPVKFDEEDWNNPTGIQRKTKLTIFRDCDTIPLMWQYAKGKPHVVAQRSEFYDKYYHTAWFRKLEVKLWTHFGYGKFISILFARLKPYGELKPHIDGGISVVHNHDVHIPISTNKKCIFKVGEEEKHLEVGKIYEVDNTITHSVTNGSTSRIHLIVEWMNPFEVRGYYEDYEDVHGEGKSFRLWRKL